MLSDLAHEHAADFHRWISNKNAVKLRLSAFNENRNLTWTENYIDKIIPSEDGWAKVITVESANMGYRGVCNISKSNSSAKFFMQIGDEEY